MRKEYPYMPDLLNNNENTSAYKREFLSSIDKAVNQKQYVRIILLDWKENPLKEIQGEITGGSITKDGSSTVRRSASISTTLSYGAYNIDNIKMDYSINKKVYIELGVENQSNQYTDYPILWFPQGIFIITAISMSANANGTISLTITLKDKMCLLNGDISGKIPVAQDMDTDADNQKILLYDLIIELVNHWGGESLNNIVIEGIDNDISRRIQWAGTQPVWIYKQLDDTTGLYSYILSFSEVEDAWECYNGTNIGYELWDFVYTDTLSVNAGDSVTSVLDKIKSYLGNFEYYYDVYGIFHFQPIKNYTTTTQASTVIEDMKDKNYFLETYSSKYSYSFNTNNNIIQNSITPNYANIKNDYTIIGSKKGTSDNKTTGLLYHLAITNKPQTGNNYFNMIIYNYDNSGSNNYGYKVAAFPIIVEELPKNGVDDFVYKLDDDTFFLKEKNDFILDGAENDTDHEYLQTTDVTSYYRYYNGEYYQIDPIAVYNFIPYTTTDWRTDIYLQTLQNKISGTDVNIDEDLLDTYGEELISYWPRVYDLEYQCFLEGENANIDGVSGTIQALCDKVYFLDFIDPSESIYGEFSINNIGRRQDVINDTSINCLFEPYIPEINYINTSDMTDEEIIEAKQKSIVAGRPWAQINNDFYQYFGTGKDWNSAFEQLRYELYLHTNYQKSISLTALPVFYLEPNTLIRVDDECTNTYGDYFIKSISLTLGAGKTMSISATESFSRTDL